MLNCIQSKNSKGNIPKLYEQFRVLNQSALSDCTQEILSAFRDKISRSISQQEKASRRQ